MLVQRAWSVLGESRKLLERLEAQLKQMEGQLKQMEEQLKQMDSSVEDIQVNTKEVWKRKDNGRLVKVTGLIFQEPKRVIWRGLPDQDNPSAYGTVTATEFKEQYEYEPEERIGRRSNTG